VLLLLAHGLQSQVFHLLLGIDELLLYAHPLELPLEDLHQLQALQLLVLQHVVAYLGVGGGGFSWRTHHVHALVSVHLLDRRVFDVRRHFLRAGRVLLRNLANGSRLHADEGLHTLNLLFALFILPEDLELVLLQDFREHLVGWSDSLLQPNLVAFPGVLASVHFKLLLEPNAGRLFSALSRY